MRFIFILPAFIVFTLACDYYIPVLDAYGNNNHAPQGACLSECPSAEFITRNFQHLIPSIYEKCGYYDPICSFDESTNILSAIADPATFTSAVPAENPFIRSFEVTAQIGTMETLILKKWEADNFEGVSYGPNTLAATFYVEIETRCDDEVKDIQYDIVVTCDANKMTTYVQTRHFITQDWQDNGLAAFLQDAAQCMQCIQTQLMGGNPDPISHCT